MKKTWEYTQSHYKKHERRELKIKSNLSVVIRSVNSYITLDDVGFLGLVQQNAVRRKEVVGADAPVPTHAGNSLGFLGQGD